MGILDTMANQNAAPQNNPQTAPAETQTTETGNMQQMYQFLMDNSMQAISSVAEERLQQKGPIDGVADLVATALAANLNAARQNGKTIPPELMVQVAKDLAMELLKQFGAPQDRIDDLLINILMSAFEQFGDNTNGMLSEEEEQQYISIIEKITEAGKSVQQGA